MLKRGRTATATKLEVRAVRGLKRKELAQLDQAGRGRLPTVQTLKDSHHMMARLLAAGLNQKEVAARTGYSVARVHTLTTDPSFQELVTHYRGVVDHEFASNVEAFIELATGNMLKSERMIADRLDQAADGDIAIRDLLAISRDAADRLGYGKRTTNVNFNFDFAARLDAAIKRSGVVEGGGSSTAPESPRRLKLIDDRETRLQPSPTPTPQLLRRV